ncbi:MAG: acetaldehyde dehydrogenase (acetylating) [Gammaproteobacteria bacterium]|nr:acetaldehyde dehydrogenase (acetylating) [Gammaproteobacteria bacterium]
MSKVKAMIVGSGNIGTDLMIKIHRLSDRMELAGVVGIDPQSEGLAMAKSFGIDTTFEGLQGARELAGWDDTQLVFDATSAKAHAVHNTICIEDSKQIIDLTPAAIGPYCVPAVNMSEHLGEPNVNMVTCGGQATIPMVFAVSRVAAAVPYAEIVASVSSRSAGPGTRANIDEFTQTTSAGITRVGGAKNGKAIIILNPAEPPMIMRNTVYTLSQGASEQQISDSVAEMVADIQAYVPGYKLKQQLQFEHFGDDQQLNIPGHGKTSGLKTTIFLEVEGAGHYLPKYSGNLDIMTSAAMSVGERMAVEKFGYRGAA